MCSSSHALCVSEVWRQLVIVSLGGETWTLRNTTLFTCSRGPTYLSPALLSSSPRAAPLEPPVWCSRKSACIVKTRLVKPMCGHVTAMRARAAVWRPPSPAVIDVIPEKNTIWKTENRPWPSLFRSLSFSHSLAPHVKVTVVLFSTAARFCSTFVCGCVPNCVLHLLWPPPLSVCLSSG